MASESSRLTRMFGRLTSWGSREPASKGRGRWTRAANRGCAVLGLAYLAVLAFPEVLFAHHLDSGRFHVASDEPIDPAMAAVLRDASRRLGRSPWDDASLEHRIYVCNGRALHAFLCPTTAKAFGSTYPWVLRRNTMLNRVVVAENVATSGHPEHDRRPLDSVIAHERTHALIGRRLGDLRAWAVPEWKAEGYCEYVAGNPSFGREAGLRLVSGGKDDASASFRYFRYGLMVRYLLDVAGVGVDELFARSLDEARVMEQVRENLDKLR